MHYVIGDVHGCYKELKILLEKIESKDPDAQIYFVGDWIDRGLDVPQVMQWVVDNISLDGKYQSVRGNHDQEALDWYRTKLLPWSKEAHLFPNSVPNTNYDFDKVVEGYFNSDPEKLRPFFEKVENDMPLSKELSIETIEGVNITYRLCHGWYDYKKNTEEDSQNYRNLYARNYWGNYDNEEIIVHGHTPTFLREYMLRGANEDRPGMIGYRHNAINLDGGCCYFKYNPESVCMLCGICLETLEEIYPKTLEERIREAAECSVESGYFGANCEISKEEQMAYYIKHYTEKYDSRNPSSFREEMLRRIYGEVN